MSTLTFDLDVPRGQIWPALASASHEQGFDLGYSRGVNDVLAAILEATEEFARQRPEPVTQTRRQLHAFSEFLEDYLRQSPRQREHGFIDGLGI